MAEQVRLKVKQIELYFKNVIIISLFFKNIQADESAPPKKQKGSAPRLLVVAPTREVEFIAWKHVLLKLNYYFGANINYQNLSFQNDLL